MSDGPTRGNQVILRDARERVIARLSEAFSSDELEMEEFEQRLTLAHRAEALEALNRLVADLVTPAGPATTSLVPAAAGAPVPAQTTALTRPGQDEERMIAILGGVTRHGTWTPPRKLRIVCYWGGVDLDFREARLPPGVTEIEVSVIMGGVQITVPPTLAVEMHGSAIMGGFDHSERTAASPDPDRPVLRVRGMAILGGVAIRTRLPGEQDRDVRRRQRRERRALRVAARAPLLPAGPDKDR